MTTITLHTLSKQFGKTFAVNAANIIFQSGSLTALLGPSGCGKSTMLRLIAGFERPDAGSIHFDNRLIADPRSMQPPERRNLGIVFQSYALWPHLDVAGNVAYPLLARGVPRDAVAERVAKALATVSLGDFGERAIDELSGGQRQRVALARCLVTGTDIILLDEPLANLDIHLRAEMLDVFAQLHRQTGATIVFVTHDQAEALALADQIVVLDGGVVQQSGSPEVLYREPANTMVAGFIGRGSLVSAAVADGRIMLDGVPVAARGRAAGERVTLLLRPENLMLAESGIPAVIGAARYLGTGYDTVLHLSNANAVNITTPTRLEPGRAVHFAVHDAWIVPD
jgi:iron(III) transport system ATP-binding protein